MSTLSFRFYRQSIIYYLLSLIVIGVFYGLITQVFNHAATVIKLDTIDIAPTPTPLIIGFNELAQKNGVRAGEKQHLQLNYDTQIGWQIADIARLKKVDAPGGEYKTRYLKRYLLKTGDTIAIKGELFLVINAETQLQLQHIATQKNTHWISGQSGSLIEGETVCIEDLKWVKNFLYPYKMAIIEQFYQLHWLAKEESLLFKIGGSVDCKRRWGLLNQDHNPLLAPDSARIYWLEQKYWLAPGNGRQNLIRVKPKNQAEFISLDQLYTPIHFNPILIEKLIVGRSSYQVQIMPNQHLQLHQLSGDVWLENDWQKHQLHQIKNSAELTTTMSSAKPFGNSIYLLSIILSLSTFLTSTLLFLRGRLQNHSGILWVLSLILLGIGNLILLQLAIGGLNERFLNLAKTFLIISCAYPLLMLILGILPLAFIQRSIHILFYIRQIQDSHRDEYSTYRDYLRQRSREFSFYIQSVIQFGLISYFLLLAMQAVGGLESGVGGYQPVELSKFIVIFMSTLSAAQFFEQRYLNAYSEHDERWWRLQQTAQLFIGLILIVLFTAFMLAIVRDFSPIMLIFLYLLLFSFRILPNPIDGNYSASGKILRLLLIVIAAIPAAILIYTKLYAAPAFLMNADRFLVWANPQLYPHSGSQVLASMTLIANSSLLGVEHWFDHNSSEIMQLPAVQDDFIATFLIYQFGYLPALGLLSIQLLFIYQLHKLSLNLLHFQLPETSGNLARQFGYSGSLFCFGFAGLLMAHWLISWSNVLGLLPIMGQPMALLSSGGSNLLLFVIPCLLISFCFAWIKEQKNN